jgi:D-glycero-alpha-D-manno-heptose-7-phosphate kinase
MQDAFAAVFGGIKRYDFEARSVVFPVGKVHVNDIEFLCHPYRTLLDTHILLFALGGSRESDVILNRQRSNIESHRGFLDAMRALVGGFEAAIMSGDIAACAGTLREAWTYKKLLAAGITNPQINQAYDVALAAGALAGKVCGAGGGGHMMFLCEPDKQPAIRAALSHLTEVPVRLEPNGSTIIYNDMKGGNS